MCRQKIKTTVMRAKASVYININRPDKYNHFPISIRVTFNRIRRYYPTAISMTLDAFEKPKSKQEKEDKYFIESCYSRAVECINSLGTLFSFLAFEKQYYKNIDGKSPASILISDAFDEYIEDIAPERIGNRGAYTDAKKSFFAYSPKAKLSDITPKWLKNYEKMMLENGRSITTVGMYCRCLRAVFIMQIKENESLKDAYPFGKGKYEIPTGNNIKKALTLEEISKIMNHEVRALKSKNAEMYRDFWILIYLCNGINISDLLRIRRKDYNGSEISFIRQKTKNTKRNVQPIAVYLLPKAKEIIEKYKAKNRHRDDDFLFPVLSRDMSFEEMDKKTADFLRYINKRMKIIAKELNIDKPVTTYYARHSFATIMKNSGANIAMISQMLGHSSILTTERYFAGFEKKDVINATSVLMPK